MDRLFSWGDRFRDAIYCRAALLLFLSAWFLFPSKALRAVQVDIDF